MSRNNILLTIDSLTGGGAELVAANLCRGLDKSMFNVSVCCLSSVGERGDALRAEGYDVEVLGDSQSRFSKYTKGLRLARFARQKEINLIHSHSPGSLFDSAMASRLAPQMRHVHTFHFGNYPNIRWRTLLLERAFSKSPDVLVAVGRDQRRRIVEAFHLPEHRIEVIWNGIDIPSTVTCQEGLAGEDSASSPSRVVLGSVSTLTEQKGLTYLLDAMSILVSRNLDCELWIVGDGPLRAELTEKAARLGLDNAVRFLGWIPNAPTTVLPKLDIFVQSSLWEAMSMVVLEAMAARKAVVATAVGDNSHVIDDGVNGFVVPEKDPQAIAEKLARLIMDPGLRAQLGKNAFAKIQRECSTSLMVSNYEALYLRVLGKIID